MGFLDNVKNTLISSDSGNVVSPEVAECQKKLNDLRKEKEELVMRLGDAFYNNNTVESATGTPYENFMRSLKVNSEEFALAEKRLLFVQGKRKCEHCGNMLPADSGFCNKCGRKLDPLFPGDVAGARICANCGSKLSEGVAFCGVCGTKVE